MLSHRTRSWIAVQKFQIGAGRRFDGGRYRFGHFYLMITTPRRRRAVPERPTWGGRAGRPAACREDGKRTGNTTLVPAADAVLCGAGWQPAADCQSACRPVCKCRPGRVPLGRRIPSCPTNSAAFPILGKVCGIAPECVGHDTSGFFTPSIAHGSGRSPNRSRAGPSEYRPGVK